MLIGYLGVMGTGKSTLALQTAYNLRNSGLNVLLLTMGDRSGNMVSSRLGVTSKAVIVDMNMSLDWIQADVVICDEVQFFTPKQIEQLAWLADHRHTEVYAYGLRVDFRGWLFPGTRRLVELADHIHDLQVDVRCWCGKRATQNARVVDGVMTTRGDTVVVGDVDELYVLLCRRHFMEGAIGEDSKD